MVSAVERPCLVLLAAYARVRGSQARRTITMRHKALLACRSRPVQPVTDRLARAGRQRRHAAQAREASLAAQPLGLSPAATSSTPATSVPTQAARSAAVPPGRPAGPARHRAGRPQRQAAASGEQAPTWPAWSLPPGCQAPRHGSRPQRWPRVVVGTVVVPSRRPSWSTAAATCTSPWLSTPTVTKQSGAGMGVWPVLSVDGVGTRTAWNRPDNTATGPTAGLLSGHGRLHGGESRASPSRSTDHIQGTPGRCHVRSDRPRRRPAPSSQWHVT